MNSVIQCLVNTPPLVRFFATGLFEKDLNVGKTNTNMKPGFMAREFAFLSTVLSSGTYRSVSPLDFKMALGSMSKRFLSYEQQDSHEVLLIVLDGLHNDVNKVWCHIWIWNNLQNKVLFRHKLLTFQREYSIDKLVIASTYICSSNESNIWYGLNQSYYCCSWLFFEFL